MERDVSENFKYFDGSSFFRLMVFFSPYKIDTALPFTHLHFIKKVFLDKERENTKHPWSQAGLGINRLHSSAAEARAESCSVLFRVSLESCWPHLEQMPSSPNSRCSAPATVLRAELTPLQGEETPPSPCADAHSCSSGPNREVQEEHEAPLDNAVLNLAPVAPRAVMSENTSVVQLIISSHKAGLLTGNGPWDTFSPCFWLGQQPPSRIPADLPQRAQPAQGELCALSFPRFPAVFLFSRFPFSCFHSGLVVGLCACTTPRMLCSQHARLLPVPSTQEVQFAQHYSSAS